MWRDSFFGMGSCRKNENKCYVFFLPWELAKCNVFGYFTVAFTIGRGLGHDTLRWSEGGRGQAGPGWYSPKTAY